MSALPPQADIRNGHVRRSPRLILEINIRKLLPAVVTATTKHASNSSTDQGGGKRWVVPNELVFAGCTPGGA